MADAPATVSHAPLDWGYAESKESTAITSIPEEQGLYIGGAFLPAANDATYASVNPANESHLGLVAEAGEGDADRAVAAARTAYDSYWRDMPGKERAKYLYRIARLL